MLLKSITIHLPFLSRSFRKSMPSSWPKVVYPPPICITIRLPFVSRHFCRSIRVRGRWNTHKIWSTKSQSEQICHLEMLYYSKGSCLVVLACLLGWIARRLSKPPAIPAATGNGLGSSLTTSVMEAKRYSNGLHLQP